MKKIIFILLVLIFIVFNIFIIKSVYDKEEKNNIPKNYIIVFKGETSDTVYTTYIYQKKKKKKLTYKYINTISAPIGYDSANLKEKVLKKGEVKKKEKIYEIALNNNAYSYVVQGDKVYTIEEFKKKFN